MHEPSIPEFARVLFNEAKAFYEAGSPASSEEAQSAAFHSSLLLAFCSLEAHINTIAEDFHTMDGLTLLDQSILRERAIVLDNGKHVLTDDLRMFKLADRIEYLFATFSKNPLDKTSSVWGNLLGALNLRNQLTHPKTIPDINSKAVEDALTAILEMLNLLYKGIYGRSYPDHNFGLNASLSFNL